MIINGLHAKHAEVEVHTPRARTLHKKICQLHSPRRCTNRMFQQELSSCLGLTYAQENCESEMRNSSFGSRLHVHFVHLGDVRILHRREHGAWWAHHQQRWFFILKQLQRLAPEVLLCEVPCLTGVVFSCEIQRESTFHAKFMRHLAHSGW